MNVASNVTCSAADTEHGIGSVNIRQHIATLSAKLDQVLTVDGDDDASRSASATADILLDLCHPLTHKTADEVRKSCYSITLYVSTRLFVAVFTMDIIILVFTDHVRTGEYQ